MEMQQDAVHYELNPSTVTQDTKGNMMWGSWEMFHFMQMSSEAKQNHSSVSAPLNYIKNTSNKMK